MMECSFKIGIKFKDRRGLTLVCTLEMAVTNWSQAIVLHFTLVKHINIAKCNSSFDAQSYLKFVTFINISLLKAVTVQKTKN